MSLFSVGQHVTTTLGLGRVVNVKMGGDDYRTPVGVLVFLDAERARAGYDGTLFPISDVSPTRGLRAEDREQLDELRRGRQRRGLRRW